MARSLSKSLLISAVITLVVSYVLYLFDQSSISKSLEQLSYDYQLSTSRATKPLPSNVMVILIDEPSLKLMDPVVGRWPWPRSIYHNLIKYISSGQPKAIMFDILFSERQNSAEIDLINGVSSSDKLLIDATANSKLSHHSMQFVPASKVFGVENDTVPLHPALIDQHQLKLEISKQLNILDKNTASQDTYEDFIAPIAGLAAASNQLGIVNARADIDGIYRKTQLFFNYQNAIFPSLSIAALISDSTHLKTIIDYQNLTDTTTSELSVPVNFYTDYRPLSMGSILSSISHLYAGDIGKVAVSPDMFTDKYIFIGASAIGLHDLKPTAISELAPGVFLHASMLGNIVSDDLLKFVDPRLTLMIIIFASFLSSLAVVLLRNIYLQATVPLILCISYFNFSIFYMQNNYILNFTLPTFAIVLSWTLAFLFLFATERREKSEIRKMFSQYVSPAALTIMVDEFKDYKSMGHGSEEYVTVLFSDIRGFTTLSEKLNPKDVVSVLNYYFSAMTEVIFKHQGTVDKFIGDAIMATWGAPITSKTHAKDAVNAAIDMNFALKEVNLWLQSRHLGEINIGIGVHTGTAILGSIGSAQKADYTVIGDTVNLSSRLEGITKLYRTPVIISGASYLEIKGDTPCQILDCVQVEGKTTSVEIYTPVLYHENSPIKTKRQAESIEAISIQAYQLYRSKNWRRASELLSSLPIPYQNQVLIEKCQSLLKNPPAEKWDRVRILSSK